jgi:hypothetical protein
MTKPKPSKTVWNLPFTADELKKLAEKCAKFENRSFRDHPGSYISKLIENAESGDETAQRELTEIGWDSHDATNYLKEIDEALIEVFDINKYRQISEKLHRIYFMALRSLIRAPIESPNAHSFAQSKQSERARKARSAKPERIALQNAVAAELSPGLVRNPSKEAGAILQAVNERLQGDGHDSVSQDVIYRLIKKK